MPPAARFRLANPLRSLPGRLSVFVFAATVLTSLAVTWMSVTSIQTFLRGKIDQKFPAILRSSAEKLELWYAQRLVDVGVFSSSEILVENLGQIGSSGDRANLARQEIRQYLTYVLESFSQYEALFVRDRKGRVALGVGEEIELADTFVEPLKRGSSPSVGDIERLGARRVQLVSALVKDRRGSAVGSLHARLRLLELDELLTSDDLGASGEIYLVGREGAHITPTRSRKIWSSFGRSQPGEDAVAAVQSYMNDSGDRVVGGAEHFARFGWTIVVEEQYDEAFSPVVAVIRRILGINLGIVLLFGLGAYWIALSIVKPIEALSAVAQRISEGDMDVALHDTSSQDEVGILTRTFNEMLTQLETNRIELHQRNLELQRVNLEYQRVNEVLEQLSITDGLTQLHNHRYFQDYLTMETKRADRTKEALSLILIDVDDFKRLNDRLGHAAGDDVLRHIASTMNELIRETDMLARYGGEEFALVTPHTDLTGAVTLAEKIRRSVAGAPVWLPDQKEPQKVTISIGVDIYHGDRELLFKGADRALYQAKADGKNCVVVAGDARTGTPMRRVRVRRS